MPYKNADSAHRFEQRAALQLDGRSNLGYCTQRWEAAWGQSTAPEQEMDNRERTARANAGTGIHDGRPSVVPSAEQSSVMRTGLGAVALYTPEKAGDVNASMYRFTRSSLRSTSQSGRTGLKRGMPV